RRGSRALRSHLERRSLLERPHVLRLEGARGLVGPVAAAADVPATGRAPATHVVAPVLAAVSPAHLTARGPGPEHPRGYRGYTVTYVNLPAASGMSPCPIAPPWTLSIVMPVPGSTFGKNTSWPRSPGAQVVPVMACVGPCVAVIET